MKITLLSYTQNADFICGEAAAVCTTSKNSESALRHAMEAGHTSVLEHATFTFRIEGLSRAALAQLTRHRLASFNVQSQRYVKLNNPEMIIPESIQQSQFATEAGLMLKRNMNLYQRMIEAGIPAEDARYIAPQAVTTELIMTMNARELLHFFSLRCCNRAQWEIRNLADEMLKLCKKASPILFEKAGPSCVTGICPEVKPCGHKRNASEWM